MKIAILGLPQAGQTQLFCLLTGASLEVIQQKPQEVHPGVALVFDPRVAKLSQIYNPKKTIYSRLECLLLPDFNLQGPAKTIIFNELRNADELCFVAREETVQSDITAFISELVIYDLMLAEKRLEAIARDQYKKASDQKEKEKEIMELCKKQLEEEKILNQSPLSPEQKTLLKPYQFLTLKPIILVINVVEDKIKDTSIAQKIKAKFSCPAIQLCAELEEEISRLDEKDRVDFMKEMGITESALTKMARAAFTGLGLISFFTVGEDEVRAWAIRCGSSAPEAGAAVHTDIGKGFVRVEVMKYAEFMAAGSEAKLKEQGKLYLKGRDYMVEDGDILNFRFNV